MNLNTRLEIIKQCISNAECELKEARMDLNYILEKLKNKGKEND